MPFTNPYPVSIAFQWELRKRHPFRNRYLYSESSACLLIESAITRSMYLDKPVLLILPLSFWKTTHAKVVSITAWSLFPSVQPSSPRYFLLFMSLLMPRLENRLYRRAVPIDFTQLLSPHAAKHVLV